MPPGKRRVVVEEADGPDPRTRIPRSAERASMTPARAGAIEERRPAIADRGARRQAPSPMPP